MTKLLLFFYLLCIQCVVVSGQMTIISDGTWKASTTLYNGWQETNFDDSNWGKSISPAPTGITTVVSGSQSMWVEGIPRNVYFRKKINLNGVQVKKTTLEISADNEYKVYINGKLVSEGIALWTTNTFDVSGFINCGDNVIAIHGIEWIPNTPSLVSCRWDLDTVKSVGSAHVSSANITICDGESYNGHTQPGIYRDTIISQFGCDSILVLNLNVHPRPITSITKHICQGETFNGHSTGGVFRDTLKTIHGCDSLIFLNLKVFPIIQSAVSPVICRGEHFEGHTEPGTYITLAGKSTHGCDSFRVINLKFAPPIISSVSQSICEGSTYAGHHKSGIYSDTLRAFSGCDSIHILNLSVIPIITKNIRAEICSGKKWEEYSLPGVYFDTLRSYQGCDSIRILTLDTIPIQRTFSAKTICEGQTFLGYSKAGIYRDTIPSIEGCDSIRVLHLFTTNEVKTGIKSAYLCAGDLYENYNQAGVYVDTIQMQDGCDSIRILHLLPANIYVPNVFSPNNDGQNDHFVISGIIESNIKLNRIMIFDRWGDLILSSSSIELNSPIWDGRFRNSLMSPNVFVYFLEYSCYDKPKTIKGDITILR
jgi:gliding motility-associated-like protein